MIILLLFCILCVLIVGGRRFVRGCAILAFILMGIYAFASTKDARHDAWVKQQDAIDPAPPSQQAKDRQTVAEQLNRQRLAEGRLP